MRQQLAGCTQWSLRRIAAIEKFMFRRPLAYWLTCLITLSANKGHSGFFSIAAVHFHARSEAVIALASSPVGGIATIAVIDAEKSYFSIRREAASQEIATLLTLAWSV